MTDQKRARAERVVYRAIAEAITADRTADGASKAAAERIDAIYSEGGEPVKMLVAYHNHEIVHLHDWDAEDAEKIAAIANVTPLYASPPSESRLRKALEEIKPQWLDYLEDMIGDRYRCICCNADEEDGGCATDFNSGWALVSALRRALSATPESNDNQGGMDDG